MASLNRLLRIAALLAWALLAATRPAPVRAQSALEANAEALRAAGIEIRSFQLPEGERAFEILPSDAHPLNRMVKRMKETGISDKIVISQEYFAGRKNPDAGAVDANGWIVLRRTGSPQELSRDVDDVLLHEARHRFFEKKFSEPGYQAYLGYLDVLKAPAPGARRTYVNSTMSLEELFNFAYQPRLIMNRIKAAEERGDQKLARELVQRLKDHASLGAEISEHASKVTDELALALFRNQAFFKVLMMEEREMGGRSEDEVRAAYVRTKNYTFTGPMADIPEGADKEAASRLIRKRLLKTGDVARRLSPLYGNLKEALEAQDLSRAESLVRELLRVAREPLSGALPGACAQSFSAVRLLN